MERNTTVTAPQVADAAALFEEWRRTRAGNKSEFFEFMTTPTVERAAFTSAVARSVEFSDGIAAVTVKMPE